MIIMGIETSCDETAISIIEAGGSLDYLELKILANITHSQIDIHKEFGGVVPKLAKREHIKNLPLVLEKCLIQVGFKNGEENPGIDMIAVTNGPGLEPALWTGIKFAQNLSQRWNTPLMPINHMEGHIASVLIRENENIKKIKFPSLALLISGGHTELIFMENWQKKTKIGETKDDAVGEAYDKVARMLSLPYPGGPEINRLAEEAREKNIGNEKIFPRPMIHSKNFDFSFSGLKTAVLYYIRKLEGNLSYEQKIKIAREFEDAVIEVLLNKSLSAIKRYLPKTFIIGGGVIANKTIRESFTKLLEDFKEIEMLIPERNLTTDNATMIAISGFIEYLSGTKNYEAPIKALGNLSITN